MKTAMIIAASDIKEGDTIISHKYGTHEILGITSAPAARGIRFNLPEGLHTYIKKDEEILIIRKGNDLL